MLIILRKNAVDFFVINIAKELEMWYNILCIIDYSKEARYLAWT